MDEHGSAGEDTTEGSPAVRDNSVDSRTPLPSSGISSLTGFSDPAWGGPADPEAADASQADATLVDDGVDGGEVAEVVEPTPEALEHVDATLTTELRAIEAVLMVAVEPVAPGLLAELLEVPVERVAVLIDQLAASCRHQGRGFVMARVAGGYRLQSHPDFASYVERFANVGVSTRLSAAALETLAIVAYKQPVSRAQIASLRGVNVDGVVRLLEHRGYIAPAGRAAGPGQAVLYATTDTFLERLGIDSLGQLPAVEDLLPGPEVLGEMEEGMRPVADA